MAEFRHYPAIDNEGNELEITIASGPVILKDTKVLLDKHDDPFWKHYNSYINGLNEVVRTKLGRK